MFLFRGRDLRSRGLLPGLLFQVTAKLKPHGGKKLGGKIVFAARCEALIERSGEDRRGGGGLDGGEDGPAAFAGVGNAAAEALERRLIEKRNGREVEQPGSDNTAAAPDFGNIRKIE